MLEAGPRPESPDHGRLAALLAEIGHARDRLDVARSGTRPSEQLPVRRELLAALEAYAAALASCGAPLPYRLRDEIELYRGLGQRG
jgi:hypothetical protein